MVTVGFLGCGTSTEQTDYEVYKILSKLMAEHEYVLCYIDEYDNPDDSFYDTVQYVQTQYPAKTVELLYVNGICELNYNEYLRSRKTLAETPEWEKKKICLMQTVTWDDTVISKESLDITPQEIRTACKRWIIEHSDLLIADLSLSNDIIPKDLEYAQILDREIHIIKAN